MRPTPSWWGVLLRGMAMGAADVVPGVSGGTVALILGIYERLVRALRAATGVAPWRALARGDLRAAFMAADGPFLLPLVAGIGLSVVLLARGIEVLLHEWRVVMYAAFVGLVAAGVVVLVRAIHTRSAGVLAIGLGSAALVFLLLGAEGARTPQATWFLVVAGAVGITALVLPGVSGAFLMVLLGQYEVIIRAIARADVAVLVPFALGALVGLATVARVLTYLLRRAPAATMAALAGAMVGSLRRLWPWTAVPADAAAGTPAVVLAPPQAFGAEGWVLALVAATLAFAAVLIVERRARRVHTFSSTS